MFTFPQFVEATYLYLLRRKLMFKIPHAEKVMAAFAFAILAYCYEHSKQNLEAGASSLLSYVWGESERTD